MMIKNIVPHISVMCVFAALLFSCDKDVSDVGGEVLTNSGISNTQFDNLPSTTSNVSLENIQTNNFSGNRFLGTIDRSSTSGSVNYGLLYQISPTISTALTDTITGQTIKSVKIKSANLILPYTYESLEAVNDTVTRYQITNIIGEANDALNFQVFKSNFDLVRNNTASNTRQLYFANATTRISGVIRSFEAEIEAGGDILEELLEVTPTAAEFEIQTATKSEDGEGFEPITNQEISDSFEQGGHALRVVLKPDFLGDVFANSDGVVNDPSLLTTNSFFENFKGIYLKPTEANNRLVAIDHSFNRVNPKIEITFDIESDFIAIPGNDQNEPTPARTEINEVTLDFEVNESLIVNTINSENTPQFQDALASSENMLIKSGVSASSISIFSDTSQLEEIFNQNPIVNSAVLRVYVNVDSPFYDSNNVPQNLWINSLEEGDLVSGAELVVVEEDKILFYEFEITQYLRGVLNVDNTGELLRQNFDFMIGASTSEVNAEIISQNQLVANVLENVLIFDSSQERRINVGSLLSLDEVPLFGSGANDTTKRPQLVVNFVSIK